MKSNGNVSVVDRIVVVVPEFRQWTGTRAMHEGDFVVGANGKLPPKEVTKSLGLKAIIDLVHLRKFDRIKHRAEALLASCGVQYLSGWAIPEEKSAHVLKELDKIVLLFEDAKADFLKNYDTYVEEWSRQNPSFAREILDGKLDRSALAMRFSAGYEAFRLQPISPEKAEALEKSVGGLAGDLIDDVSQCARTFFRESFFGKTRANRKTVNALIRIRERLNGLSFLSGSISPLVQLIDGVVAQMPEEGYFDGDPFWKLSSVVQTLADKQLLEEILQRKVVMDAPEHSSNQGMLGMTHTDVPFEQEKTLEPKSDLLFEDDASKQDEENFGNLVKKGNGETLSLEASRSGNHGLLSDKQSVIGAKVGEKGDLLEAKADAQADVRKEEDGLSSDSFLPKSEKPCEDMKLNPAIVLPRIDIGEGMYF